MSPTNAAPSQHSSMLLCAGTKQGMHARCDAHVASALSLAEVWLVTSSASSASPCCPDWKAEVCIAENFRGLVPNACSVLKTSPHASARALCRVAASLRDRGLLERLPNGVSCTTQSQTFRARDRHASTTHTWYLQSFHAADAVGEWQASSVRSRKAPQDCWPFRFLCSGVMTIAARDAKVQFMLTCMQQVAIVHAL